MRRHWWFAGIALSALGLFSGLWANNQPTTVSPEQIAKLIAQLGAPTFQEREQASKALEAIGEAALPALKEAAEKSTDAEIKRRASDLVRTLENKLHAEKLRQPTLISVAYHNTPLVEVLRDLTAKTGVPFEPRLAADRQAELSRKLVTLRLDQKPLWQVVDEVLAACGLRQAEPRSDVLPQVFDLEEGQLDKSKIHYSGVARVRRLSRPLPESKAEDGNRPVASETISFEVSLEPQRFIAEGQLTPVEVQLVDENGHVLKATASLVPSDQPPDKKADAAEDGAIFLQVQGGVVIANARVIAPGLRPRE
ncbi:MAG: hypothetical protein RMI91_13165, partial [Gemmatales bacterium]|nr:hypothetical protein [Gemmatales bacterium]